MPLAVAPSIHADLPTVAKQRLMYSARWRRAPTLSCRRLTCQRRYPKVRYRSAPFNKPDLHNPTSQVHGQCARLHARGRRYGGRRPPGRLHEQAVLWLRLVTCRLGSLRPCNSNRDLHELSRLLTCISSGRNIICYLAEKRVEDYMHTHYGSLMRNKKASVWWSYTAS